MTRAKIETIVFHIRCPAAGFGFTRIAIPLPQKFQGKSQSFEVGGSVVYPSGKGRRLRFKDGVFLRASSNFENEIDTVLTVARFTSRSFVLTQPATETIRLPVGAAEKLPGKFLPEMHLLWQLGDPPLK